jgi:ribonuclease J
MRMANGDSGARIVALGGFGEIGMNCLAIEAAGRILVLDCGVMFPSPDEPGVDIIHPSFEHLVAERDRVVGVVLTHGHEDHVAAVPYLLRELDVPIYGSAYTLALVERRFKESGGHGRLVTRVLAVGGSAAVGPFTIRSFPMPHSIAENSGLVVEVPGCRILHTGDFKLGMRGPDRGRNALDRLAELGAAGVDLMICDSTGAEEVEDAGEEAVVEARLGELVRATPGAAYVAIFSSNVKRMGSLCNVAKACGRRLVLAGRSVVAHAEVAASVGLLGLERGLLVPVEEVPSIPPGELLVLVAGTQGEERSALGRIATAEHRHLRVKEGDLVVLSSRFIPGNELAISRMIDRLLRLGARVVHRGTDAGVHVSGHGSRREIDAAIRAVRPRAFLAAHGTFRHLLASAEIARAAGVPVALAVADGEIVRASGGGLEIEERRAPVGRVLIDGEAGVPEVTMRERRLLGSCGLLHVIWSADPEGLVSGGVEVIARGVIADEAHPWLASEVQEKIRAVLAELPPSVRRAPHLCREAVRGALRRFLEKTISREPYVIVTILSSP